MANKLTNLKLHEVSLVDSPANKHAKVMLFKRAAEPVTPVDGDYPSNVLKRKFTADDRKKAEASGAAMPGGGYPIEDEGDLKNAIRAIGRAKDPGKTKAHIRTRAKALGLTELLPESWSKRDSGTAVANFAIAKDAKLAKVFKGYGDGNAVDFDQAQAAVEQSETVMGLMDEVNEAVCALGSSLYSIQSDDTIENKGEAVQECLNQFGEHVKTIVPEGIENALTAAALAQAGYTIDAQGGIQLEKGDDSMSMKAIAKALGLEDSVSEAAILTKFTEVMGAATLNANIAKMSGKHKAFMDGGGKMPKGGKDAFAAMEAGERDDHMKANPLDDETDDVEKSIAKGDAFRTPEGVLVTKKEAGTLYAVMKSQNDRLVKAEKDSKDAKDAADEKARKDKAEKALTKIGKADELGGLIFQISKYDPALADKVEGVLKHANDLVEKSALFTEIGHGGRGAGSAAEAIQKGAEGLLKAEPTLRTIEKARTEFRKRNPEIVKQEQTEASAARR